jgi:hypothetical protein
MSSEIITTKAAEAMVKAVNITVHKIRNMASKVRIITKLWHKYIILAK